MMTKLSAAGSPASIGPDNATLNTASPNMVPVASDDLQKDHSALQDPQANPALKKAGPFDTDPPPEFYIDPKTLKTDDEIINFVKSFDHWYSGYLVEYVQKYGKDGVLNIPVDGPPVRTAVISAVEPNKVFFVQRLNEMDFAKLTYEDQVRISKTAAFDAVKLSFGFQRTADAKFGGLSFNEYIDKTISEIRDKANKMPEADIKPYLDQLNDIRERVNRQEILKPTSIQKKITDIKSAFDRAFLFANINPQKPEPPVAPGHDPYTDVISLDDGATIAKGYNIMVQSDREIAAQQARLKAIIRDGNLDANQLIAEIMRCDQSISNAKELRESEELKQRDDLLKTYAAMQDAVNETLRQFGEEKEGETKRVKLCGKDKYADLSEIQQRVASMFSEVFGKTGQHHPLEISNSIVRPVMDIVKNESGNPLVEYTSAQWNTFGTQLSEIVTQLGQNTQMKMSEISTIRQLGVSQLEMATKSVSKAADLIATIGRNF